MSPCYLAEWYRPELCEESLDETAARLTVSAAALTASGAPVQLLTVVAVPTDDFVFGVFAAASAQLVAQACQRAGIPAERLNAAVNAPRRESHA